VNKKKFGHLKPHGGSDDAHVFSGVQSVPNADKLQDEDGKVVRPQENHVLENAEFICRFCPPSGVMLDFCAGTLASLLACMLLNRQGIFNDWDKECVKLATVRAQLFLYHHVKNFGPSYLALNVHNGDKAILLDPYKVVRSHLGRTDELQENAVELPKTTIPFGYPHEPEAVANFNEAAYGVRVGPSLILAGLPAGAVTEGNDRGLFAIQQFKADDEICFLIGTFRTRVTESDKIDLFHVTTNIPKDCAQVYLQVAECCPGGYINDPNGHADTKSIQPNCEFIESGDSLDSPQKFVVVAKTDINGTPENPVEILAIYHNTDQGKGGDSKKRKITQPKVLSSKEDTVSRNRKRATAANTGAEAANMGGKSRKRRNMGATAAATDEEASSSSSSSSTSDNQPTSSSSSSSSPTSWTAAPCDWPADGFPLDDSVKFQLGPQVATLAPLPLPPVATPSTALGIASSAATEVIRALAAPPPGNAVLVALDQAADEIRHDCNQPLGTRPKATATRKSKRLKSQATATPGDGEADTDDTHDEADAPDEAGAASSDSASEDDDSFNPDGSDMEREED
jgi:hypothetical protein